MAKAPQNVTRAAPTATFAPPTCAATTPMIAKNTRELPATNGIMTDDGLITTITRGMPAPVAKVAAEAHAA